MSDDERGLTRRDRWAAINRLDELAVEIAAISSWLTDFDDDYAVRRASIVLESCWRDLGAAAHCLTPPARTRPERWLAEPRQGKPQRAD